MSSDQPFVPKRPYFYSEPDESAVKRESNSGRGLGNARGGMEEIHGLFDNFMALLRLSPRTLVVPWLITAAVDLLFVLASIGLAWVWSTPMDSGWGAMFVMRLFTALQFVVVYTARVALFGPMRRVLVSGEGAFPGGWQEMFRSIVPRLLPVFIVNLAVAAVVTVGLMLCVVPGVAALFFLAFAPYLVAACNRSVGVAFTESFRLAIDHWLVLVTAIVIAFGVSILLGAVTMGGAAVFAGMMGRGAIVMSYLGMWVVHTVIGFFAWIYYGALYTSVSEKSGLGLTR